MPKRSKTSASARRKTASDASKATTPHPRRANRAQPAEIRVLCVDDHAVLVEGLRAQFAIKNRIQIVGSLSTAERLLEETARLDPDVVLLDIEMPGPDVFEMTDRLRHMAPRARVVFLSAHVRDGYLTAAYKCGAWGYFAKGDDLSDIVNGVVEVARSTAGTFALGPKVRARLHAAAAARGPFDRSSLPSNNNDDEGAVVATPLSSLSPREVAVLRLIGKGLSRTEIATELARSAKTIDGHQERIMKKLGITSRADLMRYAIREGLAEL